jgi:hypothetical protein
MGMKAVLALSVLCVLNVPSALAGPAFYVQPNAKSCVEQPHKALGGQGAAQADSAISIVVTSQIPGVYRVACPGGDFEVKVSFPEPRLALLATSEGELTGSSKQCPDRVMTADKDPVTTLSSILKIPCSAAGTNLVVKVTSVDPATAKVKVASFTLPVDTPGGTCASVSPQCNLDPLSKQPSSPAFVPVTPSKFDPNQPGSEVGLTGSAAAASTTADTLMTPKYIWRPILQGNKQLWQFLHSVLMLASFGLLMPLGALLARHKWMFGRNPETGKVLGGWFFFHIITQLLAILAAAGGVVIALLAFGWKDVPGLKLYLPHKWTGLGVMGMALLQLLFAPLRPRLGSKPRSCWTFVHSSWGSLTILAGCGNTILGALLLHDFKGEPYLHWLVPCLVVIGFMGLVALLLEAFKLQMQRTLRYNHRTHEMQEPLDASKHSKRRKPLGTSQQQKQHDGGNGHIHGNGATLHDIEEASGYPTVHHCDTAAAQDQTPTTKGV